MRTASRIYGDSSTPNLRNWSNWNAWNNCEHWPITRLSSATMRLHNAGSASTLRVVDTFEAAVVVEPTDGAGTASPRSLFEDSFESGLSPSWKIAVAGGRGMDPAALIRTFVDRLVEAARSLQVGLAESPRTDIGPVIDQGALDKVRKYIKLGQREGRLV